MANAKFISKENQAQNGKSVKWYNITDAEHAEEGVYGVYEDGTIVDYENYPYGNNTYCANEVKDACEACND